MFWILGIGATHGSCKWGCTRSTPRRDTSEPSSLQGGHLGRCVIDRGIGLCKWPWLRCQGSVMWRWGWLQVVEKGCNMRHKALCMEGSTIIWAHVWCNFVALQGPKVVDNKVGLRKYCLLLNLALGIHLNVQALLCISIIHGLPCLVRIRKHFMCVFSHRLDYHTVRVFPPIHLTL